MAYEIRHKGEAEYHLLQFHGDADLLADLHRTLRITDGIMRFRIIKLAPGHARSARPARRRPGRDGGAGLRQPFPSRPPRRRSRGPGRPSAGRATNQRRFRARPRWQPDPGLDSAELC